MLLHAYFPAGPGCNGLATGMSQPIFAETLFDEACFCPVLTLCKCTRGGYCMTIRQWVLCARLAQQRTNTMFCLTATHTVTYNHLFHRLQLE